MRVQVVQDVDRHRLPDIRQPGQRAILKRLRHHAVMQEAVCDRIAKPPGSTVSHELGPHGCVAVIDHPVAESVGATEAIALGIEVTVRKVEIEAIEQRIDGQSDKRNEETWLRCRAHEQRAGRRIGRARYRDPAIAVPRPHAQPLEPTLRERHVGFTGLDDQVERNIETRTCPVSEFTRSTETRAKPSDRPLCAGRERARVRALMNECDRRPRRIAVRVDRHAPVARG